MDSIYLIKLSLILILIICCTIATYFDIKHGIIPNTLTFSMIIFGLAVVTFYYYLTNTFNIFYYLSVLSVFILCYILWYMGVWAGGDVKLFTAISTLFIPDLLDIVPKLSLGFMVIPDFSAYFSIPTFVVIINSVVSILPILLIIVAYNIIKFKTHLIKEFKDTINIYEALLILNNLMLIYSLIKIIGIRNVWINSVFTIILSYILTKIFKKQKIFIILYSIVMILLELASGNIVLYLEELVFITFMIIVKNVFKNDLVSKALTDEIAIFEIAEGMIPAYTLNKKENTYYYNKDSFFKRLNNMANDEIIISNKAGGLTKEDVALLKNLSKNGKIEDVFELKKAVAFAPFILSGLLLTFLIGNPITIAYNLMGLL